MILVIISLVCVVLISATMLVRANDLIRNRYTNLRPFAYRMRIIGFALVATMPFGVIGHRFQGHPSLGFETFFLLGLLFVFVTTPNHLPWWRWMTKGE
jgi:ABC-type multidrug transport system permease subunit